MVGLGLFCLLLTTLQLAYAPTVQRASIPRARARRDTGPDRSFGSPHKARREHLEWQIRERARRLVNVRARLAQLSKEK
jgi:hypothetical protein